MKLLLKPFYILWLPVYFLYELVMSSVRVVYEVMTPGLNISPRFVVMPLDAKTDVGITLAGNLISLTPGTLTVDVAEDRSCLLIHSMFTEEGTEAVVASMKGGLEKYVMRAVE